MNEARNFIRYIIPGVVCFVEILLLLWIIEPNVVNEILDSFNAKSGAGLAIITTLAMAGAGFIFSSIHHQLHWCDKLGTVDFRFLIIYLRKRKLICLKNLHQDKELPKHPRPNRFQAWIIVTGLLFEHREEDSIIRNAEPRIESLSDLVHMTGTARIAAVAAMLFTFAILYCYCSFFCGMEEFVRFVIGIIIAILFMCLYHRSYKRTSQALVQMTEQVLTDAFVHMLLEKEKEKKKDQLTLMSNYCLKVSVLVGLGLCKRRSESATLAGLKIQRSGWLCF